MPSLAPVLLVLSVPERGIDTCPDVPARLGFVVGDGGVYWCRAVVLLATRLPHPGDGTEGGLFAGDTNGLTVQDCGCFVFAFLLNRPVVRVRFYKPYC